MVDDVELCGDVERGGVILSVLQLVDFTPLDLLLLSLSLSLFLSLSLSPCVLRTLIVCMYVCISD